MKNDKFIELLNIKKNSNLTKDEQDKIELIETMLEDKDIFFKIDADTAFGILEFLGAKEDDAINIYFDLISPENYQNKEKERYIIDTNS